MTGYNHKITNGSLIRGEHLKLSRAKAIYKAATVHPYIKDVLCYVNGKGDAVIKMRLTHLEIPDEPIYEINAEEEIAIICHPEDINIPEVYALRKKFSNGTTSFKCKIFCTTCITMRVRCGICRYSTTI